MGERPIVNSLQCHDESVSHLAFDNVHSISALHAEVHALLRNMELVFHLGGKDVPVSTNLLFGLVLYCKHNLSVTRDGIVHLSAVEACQEDAIFLFLHFHIEETGQHLDGIGALLVDIVTRVASVQPLDT